MTAPVIIRGKYSDLYGASMLPVLEEIFQSTIAMSPSVRNQLFKTVSTETQIWQYTELGDLPLHAQMSEGEEYSFFSMKQGFDKTIQVEKFGLGASISEEAIKDGKFELAALSIQHMARSAMESKEVRAMNIFNNGFTTATTADGQPLFDLAHVKPSGGTFRNEASVGADLSQSALDSGLVDFRTQFTSDNDIINRIMAKVLLVAPANERLAKELIGSDLKVNDVTADNAATNAMNAFRQDGLRVVVSPHLTDTDAWFLIADPTDTGLRIVDREGIQTKSMEEFDTDSIKYKSKYREQVAAVHGYGAWGTPGA